MTTSVLVTDRDERTLLRELSHRIDKELLCSINTVSAAAVRTDNPEIKVALSSVVDLLQQQATVHRLLTRTVTDWSTPLDTFASSDWR